MRRLFTIATVASLFLGLTAGIAAAGVDRHQVEERTFNYTVKDHQHTYTVLSECGLDAATGYNSSPAYTETFEFFDLTATDVHFKASYDWTSYWHEFDGTSTDGGQTYDGFLSTDTQHLPATLTLMSLDATEYRSHGEYVKAASDKRQAAKACIGNPKVPR